MTDKNTEFCAELEILGSVDVDVSERQRAEEVLGQDSIKYKLDSHGLRHLFETLADEKDQQARAKR
ncbi:hypothetical protein [Phaeobacter porticola]|uniref:Uncharacterized protein n=1 Tax=Phaeobacter porticola TaxID=1844006 RepID=A0A1L3I342_9RHOB|nr:hypothetical protein [Phaeobacter porticola]APG46528.1 hypothetical protein PhaeoP97_01101 [Phaeobacter porticola]